MQKLEEELQVKLFERQKNRLTFNKNREFSVHCAEKVLKEAHRMVSQARDFDRSQHTIMVGSCAPAPLWNLLPIAAQLYPKMTIGSEIKNNAVLLDGLRDGTYQLIVLTEAPEGEDFFCQWYGEEHLYLSLPPAHPLANASEGIWLKDIDGERMLLYADIGFWHEWSRKMFPSTHFLLQQNMEDFTELVYSSASPAFVSNLAMRNDTKSTTRTAVPILDPEAHVNYYCVCRKSDHKQFNALFRELKRQGLAPIYRHSVSML